MAHMLLRTATTPVLTSIRLQQQAHPKSKADTYRMIPKERVDDC